MSYKHGIYGELVPSGESISTTKTVPVYVGTAPIHRIRKENRVINKPLLIRNIEQAQSKLGYRENDDFKKFTLSAVAFAHFSNKIEPIGPIVVIIADTIKGAESVTKDISIINGVGTIEDDALIDSVIISDKEIGTDYKLKYNASGKLEILGDELGETLSVTYKKIEVSITSADIVGMYDEEDEVRTGIQAISDVYEELNLVPAITAAPGFSHLKEVEQALVKNTSKITDRWEAICYTDIDSDVATSREEAIEWKNKNSYNATCEKTCWPKFISGGKEIYASIVAIVRKLQTDNSNGDVPYETASNKPIDIDGLIAKGKKIKFSQEKANELNEKGITTAIYSAGKYVLWGPHMSNFEYGVTDAIEEQFDVNIMMNKYLLNDFILRNIDIIDKPMTRHEIDSLLNSEQIILNSYVSAGELLYGKITFESENNKRSDLLQGDFTFDTLVTNTPPGKSITQRVKTSSIGIDTLYGEDDE